MTLEFDLALEDLNESISINATNFYAYHNRGTAHAGRGQPEEAIENYTEAVRLSSITHIGLDPQLYKTYFNLGLTYFHLGQYERAIEDFDEGVAWWNKNEETVGTDAYTFSKEAVVVYTMRLAGKGLARGIRVNDVGPGPVETPILPDFTNDVGADVMQSMIDVVGRSAQPSDIGEALVTLAEGQISWLNGQHIIVDGGLMAGLSSGWSK